MKKKKNIFMLTIMSIILVIYIIGMTILNIKFIRYINPSPITYVSIAWEIDLPKPDKMEIIYGRGSAEGEDLEIWQYNEEEIKDIINNSSFKKIDEQNKEFVLQKINSYYDGARPEEEKLFDENIDVECLVVEGNYFAFNTDKSNEASWILLILDYKTGKLYYFVNVY